MRTNKYAILVFLIYLLLQGCAGRTIQPSTAQVTQPAETAETQPAVSQETIKLKVAVQPFITFAPYYIALKEGYYSEQGLEVELVTFNQTQQILPALTSSQVDAASGLVTAALFKAIARGGNFKIVSDKGYIDPGGCPNWALVAQKDFAAQVHSPADLEGRTINVVPASWLEYYLSTLLATRDLTMKDIQTVDMGSAAQPEALNNGSLMLTLNSEPWITRFKKAGHQVVLDPAEKLLPESVGAVNIYGPTLLGEKAEAGKRLMAAYLKGVRQMNEGKTGRNIELVAEFTQLEPALLQEMCWPSLRANGEVNLDDLMAFQRWAESAGYIDAIVPVDQFWDSRFVDSAVEELGKE